MRRGQFPIADPGFRKKGINMKKCVTVWNYPGDRVENAYRFRELGFDAIEFTDLTEAIPGFITIFAMPFMYSISEGISLGIISYVIINFVTGKRRNIAPLMYILALLFLLKYIIL